MSPALEYASIDHPRWKTLPPPPDLSTLSVTQTQTQTQTRPPSKSTTPTPTPTPTPPGSPAYTALKARRAWDLALAPAKSLPMQAFMLYMSGGGVQIFSMGIVLMLLMSPVKNIVGMHVAFTPFLPTSTTSSSTSNRTALLPQKLTYILCNLLTLVVGLWKCRSMGLFPTGTGDWLAFETRSIPPEMSF